MQVEFRKDASVRQAPEFDFLRRKCTQSPIASPSAAGQSQPTPREDSGKTLPTAASGAS